MIIQEFILEKHASIKTNICSPSLSTLEVMGDVFLMNIPSKIS